MTTEYTQEEIKELQDRIEELEQENRELRGQLDEAKQFGPLPTTLYDEEEVLKALAKVYGCTIEWDDFGDDFDYMDIHYDPGLKVMFIGRRSQFKELVTMRRSELDYLHNHVVCGVKVR